MWMLPERWPSITAGYVWAIRGVTFAPSSLDKYATNGVQRSVTPEAFSAGTTAKVNSGYLVFQSCAEAPEAVKASAAAPARMMRRLIMTFPVFLQRNWPIAGLQQAAVSTRYSGRGSGAESRNC